MVGSFALLWYGAEGNWRAELGLLQLVQLGGAAIYGLEARFGREDAR